MPSTRRMTFTVAVAACLGLLTAACGGSETDDSAISTSTGAVATTEVAADTTTTTSAETTATGDTGDDTTTTTEATTAEAEATTTTRQIDPAPLRLAPLSKDPERVVSFTTDGIIPFGHSGPGELIPLEGMSELASIPGWGLVFQTLREEQVIWSVVDGEQQGLLIAPGEDRLTLEGGGLDADGEPIVLYQYHEWGGTPDTVISYLRSFRPSDGEVIDITVTGVWESGAQMNALHVLGPGNGDTTAARWSSEGWEALGIVDARTGDRLFDSAADLGADCFSGDEGCPDYWAAVPFVGDIIGIGPVWNDEAGWVDAFGLWEYDIATGEQSLMQSWEWNNGLWYPEDMFVIDNSTLVVSLGTGPDGGGDPLPALFFDLVSGASWTAPEAAWVRPTTLS